MEDTKVKLATFAGWRKLGRSVRAGERWQMKNAAGTCLFREDQTVEIGTTAADKAVGIVEDLFEVGKIYRTRERGVRMVADKMKDGRIKVSEQRADGSWHYTGIRLADGRMSAVNESILDLIPGAMRPSSEEKPEEPKQEDLVYDDPSAMRDERRGVVRHVEVRFNNFPKDWIVKHEDHDPIGFSSGNAFLERITPTPNSWGK